MKYKLSLDHLAKIYGVNTTKRIGRIVGVEEDSFGRYKGFGDYVLLDFSENGIIDIKDALKIGICQHNGFSIPSPEKEDEFIRSLPLDIPVQLTYGLIASNVESETFLQSTIYPNYKVGDFEILLSENKGPTSKVHLTDNSFNTISKKYLELFNLKASNAKYFNTSIEGAQKIVGNGFDVEAKIKERDELKEKKLWLESDKIRDAFLLYGLKLVDTRDGTLIEGAYKHLRDNYAEILRRAKLDSQATPNLAYFQAMLHKYFLAKYFKNLDERIGFRFKYISDEIKNQRGYDHPKDEHKKEQLLVVPEVQLIPEGDVPDKTNRTVKLLKKLKRNPEHDNVSISLTQLNDLIKMLESDIKLSPQAEIQRHYNMFKENLDSGDIDPKFVVIRTQRKHILDGSLDWLRKKGFLEESASGDRVE